MKYYYLNRIAMAVLVALLLFFGTRTLINIAFEEHEPEKPGFEVAGGEKEPGGGKEAKPDANAEFIAALNKADPAKGEADIALCKVCHTFEKGGATLVGPNLYGVVGHKIAAHEGFNYTDALKKHEGQEWTFEHLNAWLTNPQAFAPGTTMAFPGIPDVQKRADVVAYLNSNSDNPLPIPEAKPAAPEEAAEAPAEKAEGGGQPEILTLIVSADPAKGEADVALCKVCHTFDKGGATLVGPNLYGVVGNKIASHEGFGSYTPALKKHEGETWTYEHLDAWLANPQAFAAGTTMAFPGIPDAKKRADVIAYLRSNDDNPEPLPEAAAAPAEEPAVEEPAPAEEPAAEAPAAEEPAPAEEPAAEEPAAEEEPPVAAEPEEPSVTHEPAADEVMEEGREEIIVNPPTVSEDAPSEPSTGEPPSASQPQPVVPDEAAAEPEEPSVTHEPAADEVMEEGRPEVIINAPTVSEDAPSEPSAGEPPSSSQPQPVYPEGEPATNGNSAGSTAPAGDDMLSSQPQPVYPDGKPEGL